MPKTANRPGPELHFGVELGIEFPLEQLHILIPNDKDARCEAESEGVEDSHSNPDRQKLALCRACTINQSFGVSMTISETAPWEMECIP